MVISTNTHTQKYAIHYIQWDTAHVHKLKFLSVENTALANK